MDPSALKFFTVFKLLRHLLKPGTVYVYSKYLGLSSNNQTKIYTHHLFQERMTLLKLTSMKTLDHTSFWLLHEYVFYEFAILRFGLKKSWVKWAINLCQSFLAGDYDYQSCVPRVSFLLGCHSAFKSCSDRLRDGRRGVDLLVGTVSDDNASSRKYFQRHHVALQLLFSPFKMGLTVVTDSWMVLWLRNYQLWQTTVFLTLCILYIFTASFSSCWEQGDDRSPSIVLFVQQAR